MRFDFGAVISRDESRQLEFKAVSSQNPARAIADASDQYAVAFLNSSGGSILWGIRDEDKVVIGVALTASQRDEVRRVVMDKLNQIEPRIDQTRLKLTIHAVRNVPTGEERYIVRLTVPRMSGGPFYAAGRDAYVRLDGANRRLSGPALTAWIRERMTKPKNVPPSDASEAVEIFHDGRRLSPRRPILLDFRTWSSQRPMVPLDFHLATAQSGRCKLSFGVVTSWFISRVPDWGSHTEPIRLPDRRHLFKSDRMTLDLFPGGWHRYEFTLAFQTHVVDRKEKLAIRLFGPSGTTDIPFSVWMLGLDPGSTRDSERHYL